MHLKCEVHENISRLTPHICPGVRNEHTQGAALPLVLVLIATKNKKENELLLLKLGWHPPTSWVIMMNSVNYFNMDY